MESKREGDSKNLKGDFVACSLCLVAHYNLACVRVDRERTCDLRQLCLYFQAQYVFIYDALLDAVICGNTEATAHDISLKLRYLNQQSPDTCDTYLMQEFKVL